MRIPLFVTLIILGYYPKTASSQVPFEGEVRQLVSFTFLPGKSAEARQYYQDEVIPLYEENDPMKAFRAFREAESPIPLDLMAVSSFAGMAGMDASNTELRQLAQEQGTSIGALYGHIGSLTSGHTDEFVEMMPALGQGDPSASRITAFIWCRVVTGKESQFERLVGNHISAWEKEEGIPSSTGRFLLADGWDYLRIIGFDSLGDYQAYVQHPKTAYRSPGFGEVVDITRDVILVTVDALSVR